MKASLKLAVMEPGTTHSYAKIVGGCFAINGKGVGIGVVKKHHWCSWREWKFCHFGKSDQGIQFQIRILIFILALGRVEP